MNVFLVYVCVHQVQTDNVECTGIHNLSRVSTLTTLLELEKKENFGHALLAKNVANYNK